MNQASFSTALVRSQCRVAILFGLILVASTEIGCANARHRRFAVSDREQRAPAESAPSIAEPAVVANVAIAAEAVNEPSVSTQTSANRSSKRVGRIERPLDGSAIFDISDTRSSNTNSESLTELQKTNSSMERLHAALSDDSFQETELLQGSLTTLELRVRVESLLARAKQLIDVGQLELARDTAQMAQDVVESAQLDYSPDEERPIDLVRRIDGQLEAIRLTDDLHAGVQMSPQSDTAEINTATPNAAKPGGKEGRGLTRIRREFSTLFRREKKTAGREAEPAVVQQETVTPTTALIAGKSSTVRKSAVQAAASGYTEAVVTANRSVSLGSDESVTPSSVSVGSDARIGALNKSMSDTTENATWAESEMSINDDESDFNPGTIASAHEPDEPTSIPPEFDVLDPVRPNHDLGSSIDEQPLVEVIEPEDEHSSDWTTFYLAIAGCSLLAFGCYRRGAT